MRSAVLQFLVAGALVVAWIWMLGRPLLTMLARRSRRDSIDHFRHQQAMLGRSADDGAEPWDRMGRFNPVADWRAQPLERRRLQVMLGFAMATFASALMAIALRGSFVSLFLIMTVGFTLHLLVAASIGARELRQREAELRRRTIDRATADRPEVRVERTMVQADEAGQADDHEDLLAGNGIAGGLFDEGFFEPIPELESPGRRDQPAPVAGTSRSIFDGGEETGVEHDEVPAEGERSAVVAQERSEATFTSAPVARSRPSRRVKGRPLYIESEADEGDGTIRAVND